MKKAKIIGISLLGLLLLIPFMTPVSAQAPSYVGVKEEERYQFNLRVLNQPAWDQWAADNMTAFWAAAWFHDPGSTLDTVYSGTLGWDPTPPQLIFYFTIDSITENVSADETYVNTTAGYLVPDWPPSDSGDYPQTVTIGNDTAKFAWDSLYGGMVSSAYWIMGVPFAPKNVNWTEFVGWGNWGLGVGYWNITNPLEWNYTLTMTEIPDGYSMYSPAMGFGNNSLPIRVNATYDTNGIMTYNSIEYGASKLYEFVPGLYDPDVKDPIITVTPSDSAVDHNYTGESISWTATDTNPSTYTITLNGTTTVVSPTAWTSGSPITYNIPDGLPSGANTYEITVTDIDGNSVTDSVVFTVGPAPPPPTPTEEPIPGYDTLLVIGITVIASIGLLFLIKKKK